MRFFLLPLALILVPGCVNSFKGENTSSFDDAAVIVSAYQTDDLAESEFLKDWPDLEHRSGDKDGWIWGILETTDSSTRNQDARSYVVGYLESGVITENTSSTPVYVVADSTGAQTAMQDFKTVSSEKWTRHPVWRFEFRDSTLVVIDQVGSP